MSTFDAHDSGWDDDIEFEDCDPDDLPCTHCGGEGICYDGADPLGDCPDKLHPCHACGGTGRRRDQMIW